MKKCSRCKKTKSFSEFYKDRTKKDGYHNRCKKCQKQADRKYYEKNREEILEYQKEYQQSEKGKQVNRKAVRKYQQSDKGKQVRKKADRKYRESETGKLACKLRNRLNDFLREKQLKKDSSTLEILGCNKTELVEHLRKTAILRYGFIPDAADLHIDHIIPLKTAKTIEEVKKLSHWTNLQYLLAEDNLEKGASTCSTWILDYSKDLMTNSTTTNSSTTTLNTEKETD